MDIISSKQAVEEIFEGKITYQTFLLYVRSGKIPGQKIGRSYLFSKTQLNRWKEVNFATATKSRVILT